MDGKLTHEISLAKYSLSDLRVIDINSPDRSLALNEKTEIDEYSALQKAGALDMQAVRPAYKP